MHASNNTQLIQVFTGNILEAGFVRTMLEDSGINAYLKDEIMGTLIPWWAAGGGAGSVKLLVAAEDQENAMLVVAEYEKNIKEQ